jgi:uncharacterized protein (DUF885 family)
MSGITASATDSKSEHDRLWKLFDEYWANKMREYPEWATSVGFPGQNGRWTDMSLTAIERRKKELNAPIAALKSIDRAKLSKEDQLNYDLLDYGLNMSLKESRFPNELMPINQLQGVQEAPANTLVQNPQNTIQDYDDIVSRLRGIAASVDQSIELMKVGVNKGVTPPQVTLRDVPQQIQNQIVEDPMKSPLLEAFKKLPADFPEAEKTRLKDAAVSAYTSSIKPAYQKLHKYFTEEYLPKTRTSLACSELPNGKEWYAFNVHQITTTDLTPAQIHERGQQEVKRIRG